MSFHTPQEPIECEARTNEECDPRSIVGRDEAVKDDVPQK
jgi:hypothetical protein